MKNQAFRYRLNFAIAGIRHAASAEMSFRTQLFLGFCALLLLIAVRPPLVWVALCTLSAASVLALELVNTALEHLADRLHPERHEMIQLAKDCAAGAVLIASVAALIIGIMTLAVGIGWV